MKILKIALAFLDVHVIQFICLNDSLMNWSGQQLKVNIMTDTDFNFTLFLTQSYHMTPEDFENSTQWFFYMLSEALKIFSTYCNWIENRDLQNKESCIKFDIWDWVNNDRRFG